MVFMGLLFSFEPGLAAGNDGKMDPDHGGIIAALRPFQGISRRPPAGGTTKGGSQDPPFFPGTG